MFTTCLRRCYTVSKFYFNISNNFICFVFKWNMQSSDMHWRMLENWWNVSMLKSLYSFRIISQVKWDMKRAWIRLLCNRSVLVFVNLHSTWRPFFSSRYIFQLKLPFTKSNSCIKIGHSGIVKKSVSCK